MTPAKGWKGYKLEITLVRRFLDASGKPEERSASLLVRVCLRLSWICGFKRNWGSWWARGWENLTFWVTLRIFCLGKGSELSHFLSWQRIVTSSAFLRLVPVSSCWWSVSIRWLKNKPRESRATSDSKESDSRSKSKAVAFLPFLWAASFLAAFFSFLAFLAASWSYLTFQNLSPACKD